MRGLYKYEEDIYRQGTLKYIFIADSEVVERMKKSEICLGEALGKHSCVTIGGDDWENLVLITTDEKVLSIIEDLEIEDENLADQFLEQENQI